MSMESIAAMARAEADEVEAEEAEEAEEADSKVAEQLPVIDTSDEKKMNQARAALDKEDGRHRDRIKQIIGAAYNDLHRCPHCLDNMAGYTFDSPDEAPPLVTSPDYQRCDKCNGYGQVLTGSLAEHGRVQTCLNCNGQGYVNAPIPVVASITPAQAANPNHSAADQLRAQGYMVIEPPANHPQQAS